MIPRWQAGILLVLLVFAAGCSVPGFYYRGPSPPGWRSPVFNLLLDESAFPTGWQIDLEFPKDRIMDPTVNHVGREWWNPNKGSAGVIQSIWRAYSVKDAKEKYTELRRSPILLGSYVPSPYDFYIEFHPPSELRFQSQAADEFYVACGWVIWSYCEAIARYRNYVVAINLDLEADYQVDVSQGLTYAEIDKVLEAMDAKFVGFLGSFPLTTPTP